MRLIAENEKDNFEGCSKQCRRLRAQMALRELWKDSLKKIPMTEDEINEEIKIARTLL